AGQCSIFSISLQLLFLYFNSSDSITKKPSVHKISKAIPPPLGKIYRFFMNSAFSPHKRKKRS
ncbi:hypothetical protein, partial [Butyricicoccus sp.]|uniref:hypothetical protein n=1 Tax=Butyricicoccus sp. TaxID=2049021 RepID=UPI003AAEC6F3